MSEMKGILTMATLLQVTNLLADEFDSEMPLTQVRMLLRVAIAGNAGVPLMDLQRELKLGATTASRTAYAFGEWRSEKRDGERLPGYNIMERVENPHLDRRFVVLRLNDKGRALITKVNRKVEAGK